MKRKTKKNAQRDTKNEKRHQTTFQLLRGIKGMSNAEVAKKTGLCAQTIKNLRMPVAAGGTLFPQFRTIDRLARFCRLELTLVERSGGLRPYTGATVEPRASMVLN